MKNHVKSFAEDTTLQVNVKDAEGNPVEEKELTQDQINFCAKVATKMFKKFSASKVKRFDAESEEIDVTLPEDIKEADVEELVEAANDAREAAAKADEVVATVIDEEPEDEPTEVEEFCDEVKEFSAKLKRFARRAKKFSEEEVAEVKDMLDSVKDAVDDIAGEPEPVAPVDEVKEFCAKFKANRKAKKFAAEDLEAVQELSDELTDAVEELADNGEGADPEDGDHGDGEGVTDIKKFAAGCSSTIDKLYGEDSVAAFKSQFFSK